MVISESITNGEGVIRMVSGFYSCNCGEITVFPGKRLSIECFSCGKTVQQADRITDAEWAVLSRFQILLLMKGCFLISADFDFVLEEPYLNWNAGISIAEILDELDKRYTEAKTVQKFRVTNGFRTVEVCAGSPIDAANKVFEMEEWGTVFVLDCEGPYVFKRCPDKRYLILN